MKMKKNSLVLGAVLLALAVLFIGCDGLLNGEKATGSSGRKLIYTTANGDDAYDENGEEVKPEKGAYTAGSEFNYYRFYVQHGSGESCYGATQKITVDKIEDMGNSVVGFIFNLNSEVLKDETTGKPIPDAAGEKQYLDSFYLLGWKPSTGKVYLNRFNKMNRANLSGGANDSSMSESYTFYNANTDAWEAPRTGVTEWMELNNTKPVTSGKTSAEFKFEQTIKKDADTTYTVYVNNESICTWKANIYNTELDQNKYDKGGLGAYANVYKNTSLTAEWEILKNSGYYSETADAVDMPL